MRTTHGKRIGMGAVQYYSALIALAVPLLAHAQTATAVPDSNAPRAGSWGAEIGLGAFGQTATLLRFRTPRSALLIGAEGFWFDTSEDISDGNETRTQRRTFADVTARVGIRGYRATPSAAKPFTGAGLLAGYSHSQNPGGPGWTVGAFGELGASYFFSPHVSLGAAGGLQLTHTRVQRELSIGQSLATRQFGIRASAVRLLGAVYF